MSEVPARGTRLAGRVVLVTGAGRGLGRAFAEACAREGAATIVADLDLDSATATANALAAEGLEARACRVDISDEASVTALVERCVERYGRIDVLVNNAAAMAGLARGSFEAIDVALWDRVLAVNARGTFLMCRAVAPVMRANGYGKIVNVASDMVASGAPGLLHYTASKGAIIAMTRALARELGPDGIAVNTLSPGFTLTDAAVATGDEVAEVRIRGRAIQRAELPSDLVGTLVYLASGDSDFVTGQEILVNGGYAMK